jgi:hypothetical protein
MAIELRMPTNPLLLVDLIYRDSKRQNLLLPQITRLTKFMYLAEVEYFRVKRERLTDLQWIFYLYGPYPASMNSVLGEPTVETNECHGGKISKQIMREEDTFMMAKADFELEAIIARIVKEWGDADLNKLLDYVYFETEPMQNAKRGELLDFSVIGPAVPKKIQVSLDRKKLDELRTKIASRAKKYGPARQSVVSSSELSENLAIWDSESNAGFPSGPAKVSLNNLVPEE